MYGLGLIAILAVMGGIIAYIGDKLGSKVGKRKMTIFGLRPKHTSILMTIVTGIVIAAVTLGVLTLASRDVRTALFGMEALKQQLQSLSQEVTARNLELDSSRAQLEAKTKEYNLLTTKINETMATLAKVTSDLNAAIVERDRAATALAKVQSDFAVARKNLDASQKEIHLLQAKKTELDTRVASLNDEKTNLQADIDKLKELATKLQQHIQIVREGVVIYRAEEVISTAVVRGGLSPADAEQALGDIIRTTNQGIIKRLQINDKDLEVLWISQAEVEQKIKIISAASGDLVVRISSMGNIVYGEPVIAQIDLYPNRKIYSAGETVYSQVITSGSTAEQSEEAVLDFLRKVNTQANNKGVLSDPLTGMVGTIDGFKLLDIVSKVRQHNGKVELTAVTKKDIFTSGPLLINIKTRNF